MEPQNFCEFPESDKFDVWNVSVLTDDRVEVHHKTRQEDIPIAPNLNIFVACFTTCWARLHLYDAFDLLGDCALYYHTDSVIFLQRPGQPSLMLSDYLGDFADEVEPGDHIVEFCSGGPKNYGYKTYRGHVRCKLRGFSLNS